MKYLILILLLFLGTIEANAYVVILEVTNNGKPLGATYSDIVGGETCSHLSFKAWFEGKEGNVIADNTHGAATDWYLYTEADGWPQEMWGAVELQFDMDAFGTINVGWGIGWTLVMEITDKKTGATQQKKYVLPQNSPDFIGREGIDMSGVYDPKPILKINPPLAVCYPTTVDLKAPEITAGSDPGLTFSYYMDPDCTVELGNTTITQEGTKTYYVYGVNDAGVSSDTLPVTVTINPKPTITLVAKNGAGGSVINGETMCTGAGLSLTVSGLNVDNGGTYAWSIVGSGTDNNFSSTTGITTVQNNLNPLTDIEYQVIGKNVEGCTDTKTLALTVLGAPTVLLDPKNEVVCAGVNLTMTATANASAGQAITTYEWKGGGTGGVSSTAIFNSTIAGTEKVFVTVTQDNGCKKIDSTIVTVKPVPTEVKITPTTAICENDKDVQFTASAKESGVTFNWTAPASQTGTKYTYTPSPADIINRSVDFKVVATLNGCAAPEFTQNITITPKPVLNKPTITGSKDVCFGTDVTLNFTGTAGNTYVWSIGNNVQSGINGNNPTVKIANTGDFAYVVKATDNTTGCSDTASVQLTGHRVSVGRLTKNPASDVTPGKAVTISAPSLTYTPNTSNGTLTWTPADKIASGDNTSTVITKSLGIEGIETFKLLASDEFGCKDSSSIDITVKDASPLKITDVIADAAYCVGDKITLEVRYSGGESDKTKEWSVVQGDGITPPGDVTNSQSTSKFVIDSKNLAVDTEYKIKFRVHDVKNRDTSTIISFKLNDVPKVNMGTYPDMCAFNQVALNPVVSAGAGSDLAGATYGWVNFTNKENSNIVSGALAAAMATPGAGLNKFVLTVTDANSCKAVDTARITGRQVVVNVTPADKSIAYGVSETLGATVSYIPADDSQGALTYAWTPADSVLDATALTTNTVHLRGTTQFKLTVTAGSWNCSGIDSVTLTVTGDPLIAVPATDKNLYCLNDTVKLLPKVSGGSGKYEFAWSGGVTSTDSVPVISGLAAGSYTVDLVVTDKKTGLKLPSKSVTFTINPLPVITMPVRPTDVCKEGEMTLTATANSANGMTGAAYVWSKVRGTILSSTDAVANVKASDQAGEDQFILKVTDDAGCMVSDTTKVDVHVITLPTVTVPAVACGKTIELSITNEAACLPAESMTYTWGPAELFSGMQVVGNTATTVNINDNTTFFVEVKESGYNCVDTLTGNISPQGCEFMISTEDVAVCQGGSIQLQVESTMQTGVTYVWAAVDAANAAAITSDGMVSATTLTAGQNYDFEVTATYTISPGLEVVRKDTATVKVWEKPEVTLTQSSAACVNQVVTFTATAGKGTVPYSYSWRGAEQIDGTPDKATLTLTAAAQNVSVTVTDENRCTATANVNNITGDQIVVSLSANPAYQITAGGTTTLTATVTTGTANSFEFRRISPDWASLPPVVTEVGKKATATDNPDKVSTYQVLAVTASGCKDSSDYIVNVVDNEMIIKGTNLLLCEEQNLAGAYLTARAYGGVVFETNKGYKFTWEAPAGVDLKTPATPTDFEEGSKIGLNSMPVAGDYTIKVTATDKNGMSKSTSLLLRIKAKPEIKINDETEGEMMACVGTEPFKLTASGPAGMKFQWLAPTALENALGATQEISVATAGRNTITVKGSMEGGCSATLTRNLVVNAAPVLVISRTNAATGWDGCAGTTLELKAAATGGAKPYTYVWTGATKVAGGKDSLATLVLAAGSNTVTVQVTDINSCSVKKQQALTGNTIDVKLTGTPAGQIIAGQSVKLQATASLGNPASYIYTEIGKTGVLGTKDTLTVKPSVSTTYQVVVISDKGCKDSADYNVNVGSTDPAITVTDVAICQGTPDLDVTATATGGKANYKYEWSATGGIGFTPSATDNNQQGPSTVKLTGLAALTADQQITVKVTAADNKTVTKTFTLKVNARPAVRINDKLASDTTFCVGIAGAQLKASGAATYTWLTPAGVAGNHEATLAVATASAMPVTEYKVIGTSVAGCVDTARINITVQALPEVTILGTKEVCAGTETVLTANVTGTGPYTYSWNEGAATASATYSDKPVKGDNQYTLVVTDAKGCQATATYGINGMGMTIQLIANPSKPQYDKDEQIQLQALVLDGGKATSYQFVNVTKNSDIYIGDKDTVSVWPDNIYKYRVFVTAEQGGCIDSADLQINIKDMPLQIEATGGAICQASPNGNLVKFTAQASGGMGDYEYTWKVAPSENQNVKDKITLGTPQVTAGKTSEVYVTGIGDLKAGKYKIQVTVNDKDINNNSISKDTFAYLTINPLPDVKISVGGKKLGADTLFCLNASNIKLTASDSAASTNKWAWTVGGNAGAATAVQVVNTTAVTTVPVKYKVEVTNQFGCVDSAKVNVTIAPLPAVTIQGPVTACMGTNISLKAVSQVGKRPYNYAWVGVKDGGQETIAADSIITIGKPDSYYTALGVTVTDANKCVGTAPVHNIVWTTGPDLDRLVVKDSCSQATLVLRGQNLNNVTYSWKPTAPAVGHPVAGNDSTYIVTSSGTYTVEVVVTSANGVCKDSVDISGSIMDVLLAAQFKSNRDTCGALKMPLTLTKAGATTVNDVKVSYSYQAFGQTARVERDTVFKTAALASAAIATPKPGIYRLLSVSDTTHGCSGTIGMDSVRVGFQPKAIIFPERDTLTVQNVGDNFVLKVKDHTTEVAYNWSSMPDSKFTTYPQGDSIHYALADADEVVKYFLTATAKDDLQCKAKDSIVVKIGALQLDAPKIEIDTNTNRLDIKIHWEPVTGAAGYKVYSRKWDPYGLITADNGGKYTAQNVTGTELTRSATDVASDTLAFFYVTAINAGGTESVPSDTVGYVYHVIDATVAEDAINYVFPYIFDMSKYFSSDKIQGLLYYFFNRDEVQLVRRGTWDYATQKFEMKNYTKFGASYKWQPFDVTQDTPLKVGDSYLIGVKAGIKVGFVQFGHLKDTKVSFDVKGNPLEGSSSIVWLPFGMANQNTYNQMTKDLWVLELSADNKVTKAEIKLRAVGRWNIDDLKWDITNPLNGNVWPTLGGGGPFLMKTTLLKPGYQSILFNSKETVVWP